MRKLNKFQKFDFVSWCKGKQFAIQSAKFNEKKGCLSLDVVIIQDTTDYGDPSISNLYEKFKVHLVKEHNEDAIAKYPVNKTIVFKTVGKCSVWGDFHSQLSVDAEVEVVA